jgi:uncharacterized RDD family membrane protein YckC
MLPESSTVPQAAGFFCRFAAFFYDACIVFCLLSFTTAMILGLLPSHSLTPYIMYYRLLLITLWFVFFAWFWKASGQTLGMLAWRIKLVRQDQQPIRFYQIILRFVVAFPALLFGGIGWWWMLLDPQHHSLQDRLSGTIIVRLPPATQIPE